MPQGSAGRAADRVRGPAPGAADRPPRRRGGSRRSPRACPPKHAPSDARGRTCSARSSRPAESGCWCSWPRSTSSLLSASCPCTRNRSWAWCRSNRRRVPAPLRGPGRGHCRRAPRHRRPHSSRVPGARRPAGRRGPGVVRLHEPRRRLPDVLGPSVITGTGAGLIPPPVAAAATTGIAPREAGTATGPMNSSRRLVPHQATFALP